MKVVSRFTLTSPEEENLLLLPEAAHQREVGVAAGLSKAGVVVVPLKNEWKLFTLLCKRMISRECIVYGKQDLSVCIHNRNKA